MILASPLLTIAKLRKFESDFGMYGSLHSGFFQLNQVGQRHSILDFASFHLYSSARYQLRDSDIQGGRS